MAERSSVARDLPADILDDLKRHITEGRRTYDDLVAWVNDACAAAGVDVRISRSALHRYGQRFEQTVKEIREMREVAAVTGRELEEAGQHDATPFIVESLQALLVRVRMQVAEVDEISSLDVARLSKAAKDLGAALSLHTQRDIAIRRELAAEVARQVQAAAGEAEKIGHDAGMSADVIADLRRAFLGVRIAVPTEADA